MKVERLSKIMSRRGMCSRREADRYIDQGLVLVDGRKINTLGIKVSSNADIELAREARRQRDSKVTILLNKPVGYVSGQPEKNYKPAVRLIGPSSRWSGDSSPRRFHRGNLKELAPAGRLDIDSSGLLILTQDGRIARRVIGENSSVEKEYLVRVTGKLSDRGLRLLNHGLSLDGRQLKPAKVRWQNEDQLRFTLREGKKRQIRRMCEIVGLKAIGLKRIRIGKILLGALPQGKWRYLADNEDF